MQSTLFTPFPSTEPGTSARAFTLQVEGRKVPGVVWFSDEARGPRPLVLVGHGGSGHKCSNLVLDIMRALVTQHGFAVAAIDGPVHGGRREVFDDGVAVRTEFRALWATGKSVEPMVADWRATLDALCTLPQIDPTRVGWYGVSMGTAYGLPFVAADARIKAAVLGMWGTCRVASECLVTNGPAVVCPVQFHQKIDDEFFTDAGQRDIFNHLGSSIKSLKQYPGGHVDPTPEQIDDAVAFYLQYLA